MVTKKPATKPQARNRTKKRELSSAERIAALGSRISDEELARIPTDAARNLDHYLYGAPKQD